VNEKGQTLLLLERNDLLVQGASQLACYNPLFGYRLESFPLRTLHPGLVLDETDGRLNLKNPACYVYPEENQCQPGDHFTVAQREQAVRFAGYGGLSFEEPMRQRAADLITRATLAAVAVFLLVMAGLRLFRPASRR
jgi:hypothetical protein